MTDKREEFANALPSRCIELALEDLEAVEKRHEYEIDMGVWHCPEPDRGGEVCSVCFAGAVMAMRLGMDINLEAGPENFDFEVQQRLLAINDFRKGAIERGLLRFFGPLGDRPHVMFHDFKVTPYSVDSVGFKHDMRMISASLKREGI
jgi:hypothetical protein